MARVAVVGLVLLVGCGGVARAQDAPKVFGKTSVEWMQILEKDERFKYRRAAVVALESFGSGERGVVNALTQALAKDDNAVVRQSAAQALGRMGGDAKNAVQTLGSALAKDQAPEVREAAAEALGGAMIPHSKSAVPVLADALKDAEPGPRRAAAKSLKEFGPDARVVLPQLLAAVQDSKQDPFARKYVAQTLGAFTDDGAKVVPPLTALLTDDSADASLRQVAIDGLARFGRQAKGAAGPLTAIFQDAKAAELLRRSAAVALVEIRPDCGELWPVIKVALKDAEPAIRAEAIRLAGGACPGVSELVPALVERCDDANVEVRLAAIQELGELGPSGKGATGTLERLTREAPRQSLRDAAAVALKKIRGEPVEEKE